LAQYLLVFWHSKKNDFAATELRRAIDSVICAVERLNFLLGLAAENHSR